MNCEEAEEIIAAHALDALPADEARAFEAHARACPRHRAAAAELRATAARLAAVPEPVAAPASLRARVLAAVEAVPQQPRPVAHEPSVRAAPGVRGPAHRSRLLRFPRRAPVAWAGIAAVLAAAVIGLTAWNIVLQRRSGSDVGALASRATSVTALSPNGASGGGVVVYYAHDHKALIVTRDLPALDPAHNVYQLWAISDGKATSLGLMPPPVGGSTVVVVPFDTATQQQVAVSIEPPGGSTAPTTQPVLTAKI